MPVDPAEQPPAVEPLGQLYLEITSMTQADLPVGTRVLACVNGTFSGDRLAGDVIVSSADWALRAGGITQTSVRAALRTHDDVVVFMEYIGRSSAAGVTAGFTFQTGDPRYAWLNELVAVGLGSVAPDRSHVAYDLFVVRR